jgi:hypothetical protein
MVKNGVLRSWDVDGCKGTIILMVSFQWGSNVSAEDKTEFVRALPIIHKNDVAALRILIGT